MKIVCIYDTTSVLEAYKLPADYSRNVKLDLLEIGKEYLVMGMFISEGQLNYLIDDRGIVVAYPIQLFDVVKSEIPAGWCFRAYTRNDEIYPYRECVWGYNELCFDDEHYGLLVERDKDALALYFKLKAELLRST